MEKDSIIPNFFYGDESRWFFGIVEDNRDPYKLGRVRVRVLGIHSDSQDDISTTELPWANVLVTSSEYGVGGYGTAPNLQPGAEVFGFFLDSKKSQIPFIFGYVNKLFEYSPVQNALNTDKFIGNMRVNSARWHGFTEQDIPELGTSNPEIAFNFFIGVGFTPFQSAGVVGNLMQESGKDLDTSVKALGNERSFGIAQWQNIRLDELKLFAEDTDTLWTDLITQLNFILFELETKRYLGLSDLKEAKNIKEATLVFQNKFERPSHPATAKRLKFANEIYNRMVKSE